MSDSYNPLLFREDPYGENPFHLLGVNEAATPDEIHRQSAQRERAQVAFEGRVLEPGAFGEARDALTANRPYVRLAFALMYWGLSTGEPLDDQANRN